MTIFEAITAPTDPDFIRTLAEDRLPLRKGSNRDAVDGYGALIAVMRPEDFIRLTTRGEAGYEAIFQHAFAGSVADFKAGTTDWKPSNYNMPYLDVSYPSGRVVGHEGRHRAAMIAKAGGDKFPVAIYFRTEMAWVVTYDQEDRETGDGDRMTKTFATASEADAFIAELRRLDMSPDHEFYYSRIDKDTDGGSKLKGNPERSDFSNWRYAAWKPSDMPPVLKGQYDQSIVVPSSSMRIGAIKGHGHYRG